MAVIYFAHRVSAPTYPRSSIYSLIDSFRSRPLSQRSNLSSIAAAVPPSNNNGVRRSMASIHPRGRATHRPAGRPNGLGWYRRPGYTDGSSLGVRGGGGCEGDLAFPVFHVCRGRREKFHRRQRGKPFTSIPTQLMDRLCPRTARASMLWVSRENQRIG